MGARAAGTTVDMRAIVVGYDGSPAAERALDRVAELAGDRARVVLVTATTQIESRGVVPQAVAADGEPAEALVQAARDTDAQMIVVGSTGSGYVARALLGSTAESLVRRAPCDVLVVR